MQVDPLNKMFISQRLSKFEYTYLRDFIIAGEFEFGKAAHIAGDELGEFEDALVSDGLVLYVEAQFVGGEQCVPELGEVFVVEFYVEVGLVDVQGVDWREEFRTGLD